LQSNHCAERQYLCVRLLHHMWSLLCTFHTYLSAHGRVSPSCVLLMVVCPHHGRWLSRVSPSCVLFPIMVGASTHGRVSPSWSCVPIMVFPDTGLSHDLFCRRSLKRLGTDQLCLQGPDWSPAETNHYLLKRPTRQLDGGSSLDHLQPSLKNVPKTNHRRTPHELIHGYP
jgi:hypothetical protein